MSRTLAVRLTGTVLVFAAAWLAYTQPGQGGQGKGGKQAKQASPLNLNKVTDDLYMLEGSGGNVAIYLTDEGAIVVDDKFEQNFDEIMANVKKVTSQPVKYVLNTHHHGDHTGSNAKFLPIAEIIMHKNARANIVRGKQPGASRLAFADEAEVYLGGKEVRAEHFGRGHTNGDAVIFFPGDRAVHTGDLFVSSAPLVDYNNGGSLKEWAGTLDKLLAEDFDIAIPGHGPVMKKADVKAFRDKVAGIQNRVSSLVREGKSKDEISKVLSADFNFAGMQLGAVDGMMAELK